MIKALYKWVARYLFVIQCRTFRLLEVKMNPVE